MNNHKKQINKNKNKIMKKNNIKKTIMTKRKIRVNRNRKKFQIKQMSGLNNKKWNCQINKKKKAANQNQVKQKMANLSFNSMTRKKIKGS